MLTLAQCRKIDPGLTHLSDELLGAILEDMYELSDLLFEVWTNEKDVSKSPVGLLRNKD